MRVFYQALITLISRKEEQANQMVDCHRILNTASDMLFIMSNTVELGLQSNCKYICI